MKPQNPSIPTTNVEGASTPWSRCSSSDDWESFLHTHNCLEGLNTLRNKHKEHTKKTQSQRMLILRGTWEDITMHQNKNKKLRETNNQKGKEDDNQSPPFRLLQGLLQPELTDHSSEENDRTTNHLPNTDRDPQQTNKHDKGSRKIADCGNKDFVINRLSGTLVLRITTHKRN